nr:RdRp [Wugcerasp virus 7]
MDFTPFLRPGKIDRNAASEKSRGNAIDLQPRSQLERVISGQSDQVRDAEDLSPVEALSYYLNARNNRHDIWCQFLSNSKARPEYTFQDTRVGNFTRELANKLGMDPEDIYPDISIVNKTPDILIYDPRNACIYVGDISVSITRDMAERRKYIKYLPIKKHFESKGFRVNQTNFIVDNDLSNISRLITQFNMLGLIIVDRDFEVRARMYHGTCNKIMEQCLEKVNNRIEFERALQAEDKESPPEVTDIGIDPSLDFEMLPEEPTRSEDELITMIKDKTDILLNNYFDNGYDNARSKFSELYDMFKSQDHRQPKSTLKAVFNCHEVEKYTSYGLLESVVQDSMFSDDELVSNYMLNMLPNMAQLNKMKQFQNPNSESKEAKVYGPWQYSQVTDYHGNYLTSDFKEKLTRGKKNPNIKQSPKTVSPGTYDMSVDVINSMIKYLGSESSKTPFLDETWDSKTNFEYENTSDERTIYNIVRKSNGAQLGQSLSMLYQRLTHLKTSLSVKDNIFVPPNASFIAVIPKDHQPFSNSQCDVPIVFITRTTRGNDNPPHEFEFKFNTQLYTYYISKLCRLPIDKLMQWDQAGHKITACSTYLITTCKALSDKICETIGTISILTLDLHQKTSELLDLLKYVSFMPFSDISRVSALIMDKFNIMLKTSLDVWVLKNIENFMCRLSTDGNVTASKKKLRVFNGAIMNESLGMEITIPSFINKCNKHKRIQEFIEEISMLNIVRGKQFYGSQFMDKSMTQTASWNNEFLAEKEKYKGWVDGNGKGVYPFESKFCFSKDAIIYALRHVETTHPINPNKVSNKLSNIEYNTFAHHLCTLRGCTKEKMVRHNNIDLHTTSLDACLDHYMRTGYNEKDANTVTIAHEYIKPGYTPQYTMSEKEQRGSGRPIATPTLITKMGNVMIEKPEQAIGSYMANNILVAGKHKLKTQSKVFKELLEEGYSKKKKMVFQCTEDQTKFSENDNTRKYYCYIKNNRSLPLNIRKMQYLCMKKMIGREHLVKRLPKAILEDPELLKYLNVDKNGVSAIIGWPQGMLNNISTSIHAIADYWITYAYNKAYGTNIITKGLVHSDDSWYAIGCDSVHEFKRFAIFRLLAKKLFCLKLNEKKLWGSRLLGELVSNFNINGEVLVPIGKTIANGFGNLLYQNWVIDTHTQISTIQQVYRQGATIGTLVLLSTILRQQIVSAYNKTNNLPEHFYMLPIELGGYPNCSVFELGISGVNSHYKYIYEHIVRNPISKVAKVVLRAMRLSMIYNLTKEDAAVIGAANPKSKTNIRELLDNNEVNRNDYNIVVIPKRGEVFSCVKHIMPKSKKISITMDKIRNLPFATDNLEMLVTKPKSLSIALGHLKSQMNTLLFSLASEHYTSNKRRLAVNQSIQATGKTVQLSGFRPMTVVELVETLYIMDDIMPATVEQLEVSFEDDTSIVNIAGDIVYRSELSMSNRPKRRIINKMPDFEDKYHTITDIRTVLLYIIDDIRGTNFRAEHCKQEYPIEQIIVDADLIKNRFSTYFSYYTVEYACNLIMQQYYSRMQPRLWAQSEVRTDGMENFLCDLYGNSINSSYNFNVVIDTKVSDEAREGTNCINTLYTVELLNRLYPGKFQIQRYGDISPSEIINSIDYARLNQSTYLKYSILQSLYNNNQTYLADYDEKSVYVQKYLMKQTRTRVGYNGTFEVIIRYGNLVMKVYGEPCNVRITVNKPMVREINTAMMIFVNRDHPNYAYTYPGGWKMSKFWATQTYFSNLIMCAYGCNISIIKRHSDTDTGVAIRIDPNLTFPDRDIKPINVRYEMDDTLRVVYKIADNSRIRVDNVKQNMACPNISKISLIPDSIDGFDNTTLLHTRVILNITMQKSFNTNPIDIEKLMYARLPPLNMKSVTICLANLCRVLSLGTSLLIDAAEQDIVMETFDLEAMSADAFIDEHSETTPEDLTALEVDIIMDDSDRVGSMIKHSSLFRLFSRYLSIPCSRLELKQFLYLVLKDGDFRKILKDVTKMIENDEMKVEEVVELGLDMDIVLPLICFIQSNNLDITKTYDNIDFLGLLLNDKLAVTNMRIYKMYTSFVASIKTAFIDEEPEIEDELIAMIKKMRSKLC